jgi:hypothetical protein
VKFYFILLTLLHIARVLLISVPAIIGYVSDMFSGALSGAGLTGASYLFANHLGDCILFTLCLIASYEHGFSRQVLKSMDPRRWRLVGQATLALGVFQTFFLIRGEALGAPDYIPNPGVLDVVRLFLPYVLFAIPAVVHSTELSKSSQS